MPPIETARRRNRPLCKPAQGLLHVHAESVHELVLQDDVVKGAVDDEAFHGMGGDDASVVGIPDVHDFTAMYLQPEVVLPVDVKGRY